LPNKESKEEDIKIGNQDNKETDRETLTEEMIMATIMSNIVEENSMKVVDKIMDVMVIIGTKHSLIRRKVHTTHIIKVINIINNNTRHKVIKRTLMEISNIKDKIIKCNKPTNIISTIEKEEMINSKEKDNNHRGKTNIKITIKETTINKDIIIKVTMHITVTITIDSE